MPTGSPARLWPRFAQRPDRRLAVFFRRAARSPFVRLVAHFLARLVRGGNDAASTEFELGAGGLLGLLAAPGAFSCLLLLDKYSYSNILSYMLARRGPDPYVVSYPDKYLFLALAMAVTGIVTVLKWDKILPDSQDYLNLVPLPVGPRAILLANAAAIAIAVMVAMIAVNGVSAIFFPLFVTSAAQTTMAAFAQFVAVHTACVMLASFFTFCAVFALLGTLAAILPREIFRAVSSWVRGGVLVGFLVLLVSGYVGPSPMVRIAGPAGLRYLPSFWYLGLYQTWQHREAPDLIQAARLALPGVGGAFLLMLLSYALSYRRRFAGVLEGSRRPSEQRLSSWFLRFLDLFSARASGFPKACHQFVVRALLRNEAHRLCLAVSLGLGWLLALQSFFDGTESGRLAAPLEAAYLLVLGLRLAFEIPAGVPANWTFRATLDPRENESQGVARRVMLSFLTPLVLLPWLAVSRALWGWTAAILDTACLLTLSLGLIEALLTGYRKVPLTCPVPGFRDNLLLLCLAQVLGFEIFTRLGAALDQAVMRQPLLFPLVPAALAAAWFARRTWRRDAREAGELEVGLTFENLRRPAVERLNLSE
jgi:hypothetical protein